MVNISRTARAAAALLLCGSQFAAGSRSQLRTEAEAQAGSGMGVASEEKFGIEIGHDGAEAMGEAIGAGIKKLGTVIEGVEKLVERKHSENIALLHTQAAHRQTDDSL